MLFGGGLVVHELKLTGADVLLQREGDGKRNWILKPPEKTDEGRNPQILALAVEDSQLRVKDRISDTDVAVAVQSQARDPVYGTDIAAKGRVRGVPLNMKGASGGLLRLMDEHTPYPIRLEGTLGDARASAKGTLTGVIGNVNLDAEMTISGGNLAPLGDVLKISLPHTKPYKLSGQLERRGPKWSFSKFRGVVGRSDLGGDFNVDTAGERPVLTADLHSKLMDIADLGGFVGMKPSHPETAKAPGKLLPSEPYNLEKLRRIDAHVKLVATRFQNERVPLDNLDARLNLVDGVFQAGADRVRHRRRQGDQQREAGCARAHHRLGAGHAFQQAAPEPPDPRHAEDRRGLRRGRRAPEACRPRQLARHHARLLQRRHRPVFGGRPGQQPDDGVRRRRHRRDHQVLGGRRPEGAAALRGGLVQGGERRRQQPDAGGGH
jgi:hypothetical protein